MAFKCADRIKETTTTEGTGAIQLAGAVAGFKAFSSYLVNNDTTYYSIEDTLGNWENGFGTYQTGTPDSILRTNIISSSNSNLIVNFGTGDKNIFCTNPADGTTLIQVDGVNNPVIKTDANIELGSPVDYGFVLDGIYLNQNRSISWVNDDATSHSGILQAGYDAFNDINIFYVNAPSGVAYTRWDEDGIIEFNANGVEFSVGTPISTERGCPITLGEPDAPLNSDGLLNIYTDADNYVALNIFGVNSTNLYEAAEIKIEKNRGNKTTPSATISGDSLGFITFAGNDGTSVRNASVIEVEQDAAVSTGEISSAFIFYNGNGTSYTQTLRLSHTTADFQATDITTTERVLAGSEAYDRSGSDYGAPIVCKIDGANYLVYEGRAYNSTVTFECAEIKLLRNRGTEATPVATVNGDYLGRLCFSGHNGTNSLNASCIEAIQRSGTSSSYMPSDLIFNTPDNVGANVVSLRLSYNLADFKSTDITTTGNITGNKLSIDNNAGTTGTEVLSVTADIGTNDRPYRLLAPETDSLTAPFIWATNNSHMFRVDTTDALEINSTGDSDFKTRKIFNGHINLEATTVAGLPSAASNTGDMYRVTDANAPSMGATVSGGGSANAMVWSNGTNWTVFGI